MIFQDGEMQTISEKSFKFAFSSLNVMKKITLVGAAFAVLSFVSCKKDSDSAPSRTSALQGKWKPSFKALDSNSNKTLDANERVAITDTGSVVFNSDGSGSASATGVTLPFKWSFYNNEQALITTTTFGSDTSYIHTLNSTELIIEDRGDTYTWNGFKK